MVGQKKSAVVGFGGMGQRHYRAYEKLGVEIVAICDWFPEKAQTAAPDFPKARIYGDVKSLLARHPDLDIISITTNAPTHAETTILCSEAGLPNVLCEKPMATNLLDAQRMIETCKKNWTRLAINHIRRWSPNHLKLSSLLKNSLIGRVRHFYLNHGSSGLGNNGVHFFDAMRFYCDSDPEWVIGFLDKTGTPNPRGAQFKDPGAFGVMQFENGVRAFIDMSEDTGILPVFEIAAEYGRVVINEFSDDWRIYARTAEDRKRPLTYYIAPMPQIPFELETKFDIPDLTLLAIRELLSGGPISSTGENGRKALEMAIALHVSEEQGNQKVYFPLSGEALAKDVSFA